MTLISIRGFAVATALAAAAAVSADAAGTYVWAPTAACASPVLICYEGSEADIKKTAEVDPFNPCKNNADVAPGTCTALGFKHYVGKDPVFKSIDLYAKANVDGSTVEAAREFVKKTHLRIHPQRSASESGDEPTGSNAMDYVLSSLGAGAGASDFEGVCWRPFHERFEGMHVGDCAADEEEQLGVCYKKCSADGEGFGPVCLGVCGGQYPVATGALCCETQEACNTMVKELGVKLAYDIGKIALDHDDAAKLMEDFQKLMMDAKGLMLPQCKATTAFARYL